MTEITASAPARPDQSTREAGRPPTAAAAPSGAPEPGGEAGAAAAAASDFDSFLRLLTAQLRNQDPLQPLDSTEFVAQLASFSSVEQLIAVNEKLDAMADRTDLGDLAGWIGLEVGAPGARFASDGTPMQFDRGPVSEGEVATLSIRGPDGAILREIAVDPAGSGRIGWDGLDANGRPLVAAGLTAEILGYRDGAVVAQAPASPVATVTGLRLVSGVPQLVLDSGEMVAPSGVSSVGRPEA